MPSKMAIISGRCKLLTVYSLDIENCAAAAAVAASLLPPMMRAPPTRQDEKCCSFITPYSGKQCSRCCKQSQMLLLDTNGTGLILKTLFNTGDVTFIPNTIRSHGTLLHKLYWRRAFLIFRGGQSRPPRPRGHGKSWLNRGGRLCPPRLTDLPRRAM